MSREKNLEGIRGWLILIAIGIISAPIKMVLLLMTNFPQIFSTGAWEALTTQGSEAYSPLWAPIIIGELLINSGLILGCLYMAYIFFTKRRNFPKWFIGIVLVNFVFIIADAYAISMVLPNEHVFDHDIIKALRHSVMMIIIWCPYMLDSKRVKATFIN
jgi:hypothetical protein